MLAYSFSELAKKIQWICTFFQYFYLRWAFEVPAEKTVWQILSTLYA